MSAHHHRVASKLDSVNFDDVLIKLPLQKKKARGRKKIPHCLAKPKQVTTTDASTVDDANEQATSSAA